MLKNNEKGKLFIVAGPSGAGKTTIVKEAIKRLSNDFYISKVATYTCRTPRDGEIDGADYHFLTPEEFAKKEKDGFFLETTKYNGHPYGSPASVLSDIELGKSFVVVTDIEGVKNFTHLHNGATFIWISTPDIKELKRRLLKRNSPHSSQLEERLNLAEEEMKEAQKSRLFNFHLVNDNFEQAVNELELLIKDKLSKD